MRDIEEEYKTAAAFAATRTTLTAVLTIVGSIRHSHCIETQAGNCAVLTVKSNLCGSLPLLLLLRRAQ